MLREDGTSYLNVLEVKTSIKLGGQEITPNPTASAYPKILGSNRIYEDDITGTADVSENITIDSAGDYLATISIGYSASAIGTHAFKFKKNGSVITDAYNVCGATSKNGANEHSFVLHLKNLALNDVMVLQVEASQVLSGAKIKALLQKIDATSNIQEATISTGGGA